MNLAIVGSRDLEERKSFLYHIISRVIVYHEILAYHQRIGPGQLTIISGGAKGVDRTAAEVAREMGHAVVEHLPATEDWPGYKDRNKIIAEECDRLVRISSVRTSTYGSAWTRDYAEKIGKPTEDIVLP